MSQEILRQVNWNGGELDPRMHSRRDLKAYFNSAAVIENLVTTPHGPLVRRPGTRFVDRVRHRLEAIDFSTATLTAPNGGTAAKILATDGDPLITTTAMEAVAPYVVCQVQFAAPTRVDLIDLVDFGVQIVAGGEEDPTPPGTYPPGFPWWKFSGGLGELP